MNWKKQQQMKSNIPNKKIQIQQAINIENELTRIKNCRGIFSCFATEKVEDDFKETNKIISELFGGNKHALTKFISMDILKRDVYNELASFVNLFTSFNASNFEHNFFTHVKINALNDNYELTFILEIPLFKPTNLFRFLPKPIISNKNIKLLKTNQTHLVISKGKYIFYNEKVFEQYCFNDSIRFCYQPHDEWTCETNQFLTTYNTQQCYHHIENDMITQFGNDIFFTVIRGIRLFIEC